MVRMMDGPATTAHDLPLLYRTILDLVGQLEQFDDRVMAGRLRREATRAYSRPWDSSQRRRLVSLESRLRERVEKHSRPPQSRLPLGRPARTGA
jgi:hypothetical protein